MPRHKRKKRAAASKATPGVKRTDWLVGDLVVAKLRGHRPWPAQIQKPEDFGYEARPHRIFITFFGTDETCFCSYNKITPFTGAVRKSFAEQLQKINTNQELERAIKEIFAADDELKMSMRTTTTTTTPHGSSRHKEDEAEDIMAEGDGEGSEKSQQEEKQQQKQSQTQTRQQQPPPVVERTRKRARAVDEEGVVDAVDEIRRPAKTAVKSMAVEQVQKLPRKVRIKVSSQSSDSPRNHQQAAGAGDGGEGGEEGGDGGALPSASEKASVSSSEAPSTEISPHPTSDSAAVVISNVADKNGDEPTSEKRADTTTATTTTNSLETAAENATAAKVSDVAVVKHNTENGVDVKDKKDTKDKVEELKVDKMEVDGEASPPGKGPPRPPSSPPVAAKGVYEDAESRVEKMDVDDDAVANPTADGMEMGSTTTDASNKSVVVPVDIGVVSKEADDMEGEGDKIRPEEEKKNSSRARADHHRQQCETAQLNSKADALEERLQVAAAGTKEDEASACPPPSSYQDLDPETQTVSKAEAVDDEGIDDHPSSTTKAAAEPDATEEPTTIITKDSTPVKLPITTSSPSLSRSGITTASEDVKTKQDREPSKAGLSGSGTAVDDAASGERVSSIMSGVPVEAAPPLSKEQEDSISGAKLPDSVPVPASASVPVSGQQVTASKTTDEKVPTNVSSEAAAPLSSKGQDDIKSGAKQPETGGPPASTPVSGQVKTGSEKVANSANKAIASPTVVREETVPAVVTAHEVSGSAAEQNGTVPVPVPASVTEQGPVVAAAGKDEAILSTSVKGDSSVSDGGLNGKKGSTGLLSKDEPVSIKSVKEAAVSEAQNKKEGSGSASKDDALSPPLNKEVSESGAQDKKDGSRPGSVPHDSAPLPSSVKEVALSPPHDQNEGFGTAAKNEALKPPADEKVSVSSVSISGAQEKEESTSSVA